MIAHDETEVLVVGAGPVGMLTALLLADGGIKVRIIDEEWRTGTHSYACALHRRTLKLLDRLGLAQPVLARGRRLDSVGIYDEATRLGEMRLAPDGDGFPLAVVLPQSGLEELLEQRLNQQYGVAIDWNHRLSRLEQQGSAVTATIDRLAGTATGYIIPRWELVVKKTYQIRPAFVVGADGHESQVRHNVGIGYAQVGRAEAFGVYELELDGELEPEQRVVLSAAAGSFLWPLAGKGCRWSFQMLPVEPGDGFPEKERRPWRFHDEAIDRVTKERVQELIGARAPWFTRKVEEVGWSVAVAFERRLATEFGRGRCWLAGDAAHQTSPAGMQSMNVGLCEAADLAGTIIKVLRQDAPLESLQDYNQQRQEEWHHLLGLKGEVRPRQAGGQWTKERCDRLLPCVPASGENLSTLLNSVGLEWLQ